MCNTTIKKSKYILLPCAAGITLLVVLQLLQATAVRENYSEVECEQEWGTIVCRLSATDWRPTGWHDEAFGTPYYLAVNMGRINATDTVRVESIMLRDASTNALLWEIAEPPSDPDAYQRDLENRPECPPGIWYVIENLALPYVTIVAEIKYDAVIAGLAGEHVVNVVLEKDRSEENFNIIWACMSSV